MPVMWTGGHADRLAAAKLWIISPTAGDLPYLSTALYALATVPSDGPRTMATDARWRLYVNPDWLSTTPTPEVGRMLVHQLWHLLADHADRATTAQVHRGSAAAWRTAADLTVGEVLPWAEHGLPAATDRGLPRGRSAEEYFALLAGLPAPGSAAGGGGAVEAPPDSAPTDGGAQRPQDCGSGCDGIPRGYDLPATGADPLGLDTHSAESLRREVARGLAEHHRARGGLPGEWGRWIGAVLDPVVPWPRVLRAAVRRGVGWGQGHTDFTYSRISRRQASAGAAILPALRRPVPAVVIILDTSGSVEDGLVAQALGEVEAVLASLAIPGTAVTVMAVDAAVHTVARVRDVASVELAGGGGTDMGVGIAAAVRTRPAPEVVIVLTDGYTPWPAAPPRVAVVAGVLGRESARLPATPWWVQRVEVVVPQ